MMDSHNSFVQGIALAMGECKPTPAPFFAEAEHLPIRMVPTHEFTIGNEEAVWFVRLLCAFLVADTVRKWGAPFERAHGFIRESKIESRIVVCHLFSEDCFVKEYLPRSRSKVLSLGQDEGFAVFRRSDMTRLERLSTWERFVRVLDETDKHTLIVPCAGYVAILPLPETQGPYSFSCDSARFERLSPEQILLKYHRDTEGMDIDFGFEVQQKIMDLVLRCDAQA